ncbi:MAG: hypothetical protein IT257_11850 [Chitinophagaceae bacterium]|nr:hypothetical protein [Chitinophagaceae bacterium]
MNKQTTKIFIVSAVILITALMRVINSELHIYNLVPVAALGIFSGSVLRNKYQAYLIPLLAMLISDMGMALFTNTPGFYGVSQFVNYGALILVTLLGSSLHKRNVLNIAGYSIAGSLVFFLLSNFGTFLSGYYGYSAAGLTECYTMALPFYKSEMATTLFLNSFAGDLSFSMIAFGIYHMAKYKLPVLQIAE